ncbi:peptidoglycan-associated lipoprotein Pal [Desulfolithobacter sp.]
MMHPFRIIPLVLLGLLLVMTGGCSKKTIMPYPTGSGTGAPEAKSIDYAAGQQKGTIIEEDMAAPQVDTLDTTTTAGESLGGFAISGDQNSEEYKKLHGRSSPQMQPIYFNFDQATIRADQIPRLEANAEYLKNNPAAKVVIEGNCDERGTNEYNLALGERRALNAKKYLVELGVEPQRIRTVSYGEERPLFTGEDEFSWAQNRRDDFILE